MKLTDAEIEGVRLLLAERDNKLRQAERDIDKARGIARARAQVTADKVEQIYKLRQAVRVAIDYALSYGSPTTYGSPATYLSSEQLDSATEAVIKIIGAQHG